MFPAHLTRMVDDRNEVFSPPLSNDAKLAWFSALTPHVARHQDWELLKIAGHTGAAKLSLPVVEWARVVPVI